MEKGTDVHRMAYGIVKNVFDDTVELLLKYNPEGESRLCTIPLKFWKDTVPSSDQHIEISWDPKNKTTDPEIREIPQWIGNTPTSSELTFLRNFYGLDFSSKVLFVIGPNRPFASQKMEDMLKSKPELEEDYQKFQRQLRLKAAGWGECLALTYLIPLLKYLGVGEINFKLCETNFSNFVPQQYAEYSIFFLGSPKSNDVLANLYWNQFKVMSKYEFRDYDLIINNQLPSYTCVDETYKVPIDRPDLMNVKDYFLLAKLPNPYSEKAIRPNCFICAGIGTIGTAFASVALGSKKSTRVFFDRFQNNPFVIACSVEMQGMFNPKHDPVSMFFDGNSNTIIDPPIELLPNALSSSKIWSIYSEEDFQRDLKKLL